MLKKPNIPLSTKVVADIALVFVTAIWGLTFVMVKDAVARMPVMDFLAIRFTLATIIMIMIRPSSLTRLDKTAWLHGGLLGIMLALGYIGQTFGLQTTSAAVAGFITGMFVIFTPLIAGLILRRSISITAWFAVILATAGLSFISLKGFSLGSGEILVLLCAICFAIHIVGLGEWSAGRDSYSLAIVQLAMVSILSVITAAPGGITIPPDFIAWQAIIVTAVFATAAAFLIQTWAQSLMPPTQTAVILTMEPVFAGIFAVLIGGERLGWRTLIGGALVIIAMYVAELGPRQSEEGKIAHLEA